MNKFKVGDIVISKNGRFPARVINEGCWDVNVCYLHNNNYTCLSKPNLILYNGPKIMNTESQMLYQFKTEDGTVAYGTHIGTNSQSLWVMEEKGSGRVITIDPKEAEEVLPYTFSAKMRSKNTHYISEEGMVNKGDVLLYTGGDYPEIAVVTAVNTKNKTAQAEFIGCRLNISPLKPLAE